MRVPEEAGLGNAKVTLSFAAWKEGKVAPVTLEVQVVKAAPGARPARPAGDPPAETPGVVTARNNLRQIALALHAHVATHGRFPAAAIHGKDGTPLLSWRVAILPYIEQDDLYRQFKLDEPWDSPHNKKLLNRMPSLYAVPGKEKSQLTHYQVFTGPGALFDGKEGVKPADIRDGIPTTILAVEAKEGVPWTKPADLVHDAKKPLPALGGLAEGGFHLLWADGTVRFISARFDEAMLRAAITRAGGEKVERDKLNRK